jgi:flavoprotein
LWSFARSSRLPRHRARALQLARHGSSVRYVDLAGCKGIDAKTICAIDALDHVVLIDVRLCDAETVRHLNRTQSVRAQVGRLRAHSEDD